MKRLVTIFRWILAGAIFGFMWEITHDGHFDQMVLYHAFEDDGDWD